MPEFTSASVVLLQETHIQSEDDRLSAVEQCARLGWRAAFSLAATLESGKPSGGVAILIREGLNIGSAAVTVPSEFEHRMLGQRLEVTGFGTFIALSCYFEVGRRLTETNLGMLAAVAQLQESQQLPVLCGGDFNVPPERITAIDFLGRASMVLCKPDAATHRTKKSKSTIDYFVASQTIAYQIGSVQTLADFPLAPHRPVRLRSRVTSQDLIPVLFRPAKLPTSRPFGPQRQESDWGEVEAILDEIQTYVVTATPAQQLTAWDVAYGVVIRHLEAEVCLQTDTPLPGRSIRGQPPRIKWVPRGAAQQQTRKSWKPMLVLCSGCATG